MMHYKLNEKNEPVECSIDEWGIESESRVLKRTEIGKVSVSTVFLGIDHGYGGVILLWETMIFGGRRDQWQTRYSTYDQAKVGHERVVAEMTAPWYAKLMRIFK